MRDVCECGEPVFIRKSGECRRCYNRRWYQTSRAGDEGYLALRHVPTDRQRTPTTRKASGDPASYSAAHGRVRRQRGPASDWRCIQCGAPAEQWAYRSTNAREIRGTNRAGNPRVWSPDPADYDPMCTPCHAARDGRRFRTGYRFDPDRARVLRRKWGKHA